MAEVYQDLIIEILLLLPVNTILRFRCVCKSLCGIINSPDFINWHLSATNYDNRSTRRKLIFQEYLLIPHFHINPVPIDVIDMVCPLPRPIKQFVFFGKPTCLGINKRHSNNIYAHCNGLVLLEEALFSLVLWNPSTRKSRKLPPLPELVSVDGIPLPAKMEVLGFGYDSSKDDYKIIVKKEKKDTNLNCVNPYEICILELRSGYWRRIELPCDFKYLGRSYRNCFVDGAFHFDCTKDVLFTFDLARETFSKSSLPDFGQTRYFRSNLQVVEGCLCVGNSSWYQKFELYARKKNDGGEFFWTKLFSITSSLDFFDIFQSGEILGFSKDGDQIYVMDDRYAVFLYDFKEKIVKEIVTRAKDNRMVLFCEESLVWIEKKNRRKKKKKQLSNKSTNSMKEAEIIL